jgi:hypothetical protein
LLGPALGAWKKLQTADRAAIAEIVRRDGAIDTGGIWASTWLGCRGWETPLAFRVDRRSAKERRWAEAFENVKRRLGIAQSDARTLPCCAPLSDEQEAEQALASGAPILRAYSDEWWTEHKRRLARGQSTYTMDKWAEYSKGWPAGVGDVE